MLHIPRLLLLMSLAASSVHAQTEEWSCPPPDKVALLVRAPGWISGDTLNYPGPGRPALRFARMRQLVHGPAAVCFYKVDDGGELQFWKFGSCEAAAGHWTSSGPNRECEARNPADCVLKCTPK